MNMKRYVPLFQVIKGFFYGGVGFVIIQRENQLQSIIIAFLIYGLCKIFDNEFNGYRFNAYEDKYEEGYILESSSEDQVYYNAYLDVGLYLALLLFRNQIPSSLVDILWVGWIYIPITTYLGLRRLRTEAKKYQD